MSCQQWFQCQARLENHATKMLHLDLPAAWHGSLGKSKATEVPGPGEVQAEAQSMKFPVESKKQKSTTLSTKLGKPRNPKPVNT